MPTLFISYSPGPLIINGFFSPNSRQLLLTTLNGIFLLNSNEFTPQNLRVNIANTVKETLIEWDKEKTKKEESQLKNLPQDLVEIFKRRVKTFTFSPDENMVMYIASSSTSLNKDLISPLPGSSTQKENRDIIENKTYIYDIKEDKNFLIKKGEPAPQITPANAIISPTPSLSDWLNQNDLSLSWYPDSKHIIMVDNDTIYVAEYDGQKNPFSHIVVKRDFLFLRDYFQESVRRPLRFVWPVLPWV